jgi:uncharacterized protein YxjI
MSIGDDSWIDDEAGNRIFKANGKALHPARPSSSRTPRGAENRQDQERALSVRDKMHIERDAGSATSTRRSSASGSATRSTSTAAPDLKRTALRRPQYEIEARREHGRHGVEKWFRIRHVRHRDPRRQDDILPALHRHLHRRDGPRQG